MVTDERNHASYNDTLAEIEAELASLQAERETLVAKAKARKEELAALEAQLPFQWQQYKSKMISLLAVQQAEATVRQARRSVSIALEEIYLCDMAIATRKEAACDERLESMGDELPSLLARRAALLEAKGKASAVRRQMPGKIGALQRTRDAGDIEDAEIKEKAAMRLEAQEDHRIAQAHA